MHIDDNVTLYLVIHALSNNNKTILFRQQLLIQYVKIRLDKSEIKT